MFLFISRGVFSLGHLTAFSHYCYYHQILFQSNAISFHSFSSIFLHSVIFVLLTGVSSNSKKENLDPQFQTLDQYQNEPKGQHRSSSSSQGRGSANKVLDGSALNSTATKLQVREKKRWETKEEKREEIKETKKKN